ncbi:MAG: alkaline phosphatase D family protein, partial [Planctomycetota bacterium]
RDWVQGMWFPHSDLTRRIAAHDPDVMFFAGDQIYEGGSPTRKDVDNYELDYLYKWYMFCRTFGELTRSRPTVTVIDDHDIYQGNLWGASGRKTKTENRGGYVHPAWFVKMVERTQTSHLPDPVDPEPIGQGIGVYFTQMTYGGVGFAIIEDRKFKDGSRHPETNAWRNAQDESLNLLGERQLAFLRDWAGDWEGQDLKAVLSQTVFAQANTHSGAKLGRMKADSDTNGFPVPGRNRAVDAIRRAFAVHLCGDQHLATLLKHGIDKHGDAMWSFCGPSAANFWPRAWVPGIDEYAFPDSPEAYTGDHVDGYGNRITMYAAANPGGEPSGLLPTDLYDRVPGYGIARFHREAMQITFECWPRHADPADDAQQYEGWPRTVDMADNYARTPVAHLPTIEVTGVERPVIRVADADTGELIYARRFQGPKIEPGVFAAGTYTVEIGEPGTPNWQKLEPMSVDEGDRGGDTVAVRFGSASRSTPESR